MKKWKWQKKEPGEKLQTVVQMDRCTKGCIYNHKNQGKKE